MYKRSTNNNSLLDYLSYWHRAITLVVLITFSSSIFSPVFASINSNKEGSKDSSGQIDDSSKIKINTRSNYLSRQSSKAIIKSEGQSQGNSTANTQRPYLFYVENRYKPHLNIGGAKYFNQGSSVAGIYDLFIPLLQTDNQLLFADLRIFDRSGGSFEGNAHLGFRKLYLDKKQMFGIYAAFDRKRSEHRNWLSQIMFGAEYWQGNLFLGFNLYQPIGKAKRFVKRESSDIGNRSRQLARSIAPHYNISSTAPIVDHYENAQSGFDAEVGYSFTDAVTGYVGGYYFHKDGTETTSGPKLRFTYDYTKSHGRILGVLDGVGIEAGVQHDQPRGTSGYIGIKFKICLTGPNKNSNLSGFERHMTELVRRDPDIVIDRSQEEGHRFYQKGENGFKDFTESSKETLEELLQEFMWLRERF